MPLDSGHWDQNRTSVPFGSSTREVPLLSDEPEKPPSSTAIGGIQVPPVFVIM